MTVFAGRGCCRRKLLLLPGAAFYERARAELLLTRCCSRGGGASLKIREGVTDLDAGALGEPELGQVHLGHQPEHLQVNLRREGKGMYV